MPLVFHRLAIPCVAHRPLLRRHEQRNARNPLHTGQSLAAAWTFPRSADALADVARADLASVMCWCGDLTNSCATIPPLPRPLPLAGEGSGDSRGRGRGRGWPALDCGQHCLQNGFGVIAYLVIPESQDPESLW